MKEAEERNWRKIKEVSEKRKNRKEATKIKKASKESLGEWIVSVFLVFHRKIRLLFS